MTTEQQPTDQPTDQPTEEQEVTELELYNALLRAKRLKRRNRYTFVLRGVRYTCDESYYEAYFNAHGYESKQPENRVSEWIMIGV